MASIAAGEKSNVKIRQAVVVWDPIWTVEPLPANFPPVTDVNDAVLKAAVRLIVKSPVPVSVTDVTFSLLRIAGATGSKVQWACAMPAAAESRLTVSAMFCRCILSSSMKLSTTGLTIGYFFLRNSLATLAGGHFPLALPRPLGVEHIAMNRCCLAVLAGMKSPQRFVHVPALNLHEQVRGCADLGADPGNHRRK